MLRIIIISSIFISISLISYAQCVDDCTGDATRYGEATGLNNTGTQVSLFGRSAGLDNEGNWNSFFGYQAGRVNTTGDSLSFFGHRAGESNTTGSRNNFFGQKAGQENTIGFANSFFGQGAGQANTTGSHNSFFGQGAGQANTTSGRNSFFGQGAGQANTTGHQNSFFGYRAGDLNTTGSFNIAIGYQSGPPSGDEDIDSTLYIDVKPTSVPLIYGHFNQRIVRINGEFEVMGAIDPSSSKHVKQEFKDIDPVEILDKLTELNISTWEYIDKPDIRHIGPVAEDFYAAFGLGKGNTTIATVDADGIALAAIQALKKENDALRRTIKDLDQRLRNLEER